MMKLDPALFVKNKKAMQLPPCGRLNDWEDGGRKGRKDEE
jgi:hypothetical protein